VETRDAGASMKSHQILLCLTVLLSCSSPSARVSTSVDSSGQDPSVSVGLSVLRERCRQQFLNSLESGVPVSWLHFVPASWMDGFVDSAIQRDDIFRVSLIYGAFDYSELSLVAMIQSMERFGGMKNHDEYEKLRVFIWLLSAQPSIKLFNAMEVARDNRDSRDFVDLIAAWVLLAPSLSVDSRVIDHLKKMEEGYEVVRKAVYRASLTKEGTRHAEWDHSARIYTKVEWALMKARLGSMRVSRDRLKILLDSSVPHDIHATKVLLGAINRAIRAFEELEGRER
jgi:hypothetical protein